MTLVTTGKEEFSRVAVLQDLQVGRLGVDAGAALLCVTRRQVFRLQKAFLAEGSAGQARQPENPWLRQLLRNPFPFVEQGAGLHQQGLRLAALAVDGRDGQPGLPRMAGLFGNAGQ